MITIAPTAAPNPTPPATTPPAAPDLSALAEQFTGIATKLTASDATITTMVADKSPVGAGWGPHLSAIAGALQSARDELLVAKPDVAADLGAKLGLDVLRLSEASGSLSIMARQRATLSEGWTAFLDTAIADATAAAELLVPPAKDPAEKPPASNEDDAHVEATRAVAPTLSLAGEPGSIDHCRTIELTPPRF
jgi:hypothetical protein